MRDSNDSLHTKTPGETDLDPNALNAQRLNILRTFFGIEVDADQTIKLKNDVAIQSYQRDIERQNTLTSRRDDLRASRLEVVRKQGELNIEKQRLAADSTATDADKKQNEAEIAAKEAEKNAIDSEIQSISDDLKALNTGAPSVSSPTPGMQGTLPESVMKETLQKAASASPKLDASAVLDNYIQMQYEIIAKQLTLLRDSAGKDQRVLFLELPISIYSTPGKGEDHVAQVRYTVESFQLASSSSSDPRKQQTQTCAAPKDGVGFKPYAVDLIPRQSALNVTETHDTVAGFNLLFKLGLLVGVGAKVDYQRQREQYDQFLQQDIFAAGFGKGEQAFGWTFGPKPGSRIIAPGVRTAFAVIAAPAATCSLTIKMESIAYKRNQTPRFEEGSSNGTATPQIYVQPKTENLQVDVPAATQEFHIDAIDYTPVKVGERITVFLRGKNFSPTLGVLVNGYPLTRAVALAEPEQGRVALAAPSNQPVQGAFEYLNTGHIVLSFAAQGFTGTPLISLVTPTTALAINRFDDIQSINGKENNGNLKFSLETYSQKNPMFYAGFTLGMPRVMSAKKQTNRFVEGSASEERSKTKVTLFVPGTGLLDGAVFSVNGVPVEKAQYRQGHYEIVFDALDSARWTILATQTIADNESNAERTMDNPLGPRVSGAEIIGYWKKTKDTPARLLVRISGTGFERDPSFPAPVSPRMPAPPPPNVTELIARPTFPGCKRAPLEITAFGGTCRDRQLLSTGELLVDLSPEAETVVLNISNDGLATVLKVNVPKDEPEKPAPTVPTVAAGQTFTVPKDSSGSITIKGEGLAAIKSVRFNKDKLDYQSNKEGRELTVILNSEVTKNLHDVTLLLEKKDSGFLPVTLTIVP